MPRYPSRSRYPPPVDRLYNLCRACGHHWDQARNPTCVCRGTGRGYASDMWSTEFVSSIPIFDAATAHSSSRPVSPPLRYDQPMMPPVEPPPPIPSYLSHAINLHDGANKDPFTTTPVPVFQNVPPQQAYPPFHPQLATPMPSRPYPSYPLNDESTTHADIPVIPALPPQQTSLIPPHPQLYHYDHIPTRDLYPDPGIIEDGPFVVSEDMNYRYDPVTSRYIPAPDIPMSYVTPDGYWPRAPAHLGFDDDIPDRRWWDPK